MRMISAGLRLTPKWLCPFRVHSLLPRRRVQVTVAAQYVYGSLEGADPDDLLQFLPDSLSVRGRIKPKEIWDYVEKTAKVSQSKAVVVTQLDPLDDDNTEFISLFAYFNSRKRCGVVGASGKHGVKDMYVIPVAASDPLPPLCKSSLGKGPGLPEKRTKDMLIAVFVVSTSNLRRSEKASASSYDKRPASTSPHYATSPHPQTTSPADLEAYSPSADMDDTNASASTASAAQIDNAMDVPYSPSEADADEPYDPLDDDPEPAAARTETDAVVAAAASATTGVDLLAMLQTLNKDPEPEPEPAPVSNASSSEQASGFSFKMQKQPAKVSGHHKAADYVDLAPTTTGRPGAVAPAAQSMPPNQHRPGTALQQPQRPPAHEGRYPTQGNHRPTFGNDRGGAPPHGAHVGGSAGPAHHQHSDYRQQESPRAQGGRGYDQHRPGHVQDQHRPGHVQDQHRPGAGPTHRGYEHGGPHGGPYGGAHGGGAGGAPHDGPRGGYHQGRPGDRGPPPPGQGFQRDFRDDRRGGYDDESRGRRDYDQRRPGDRGPPQGPPQGHRPY